jgi:hypothetical protein
MSSIRRFLGAFVFVAAAALALPVFAAKIFTIAPQSTGTNSASVLVKNITPDNNSTINSYILYKPAGATSISFVSSSDPTAVAVGDGSGNLKVSGFNGLKSQLKNPYQMTINVTVVWGAGGPPACGAGPLWNAVAYTGNFSSTTFALYQADGVTPAPNGIAESLNCYTLTGLPGTLNGGVTNKVYPATLTNTSGAGGASITSLTVSAGAGVTATVAAFAPIAPGAFAVVNVTVTTTCSAAAGNWSSSAGGAFSGSTAAASYTVNGCTVGFNPGPPANIGNGVAITPPIVISAADGGGGALPWNGSVTWTVIGAGGSVNNPAGTCVDVGTCSTWSFAGLIVTGTVGNTYQLKATISVGSATSAQFTIWGGILNCGDTAGQLDPADPLAYVLQSDQGKYGLTRGPNKDAGNCVQVPYTFTLNISTTTTQTSSFVIPSGTGQKVAVEYVVVFAPIDVDSQALNTAGWTSARPNVSWGIANPQLNSTDYVPALACVKDAANFALISSADLAGFLPVIPNVAPYNTNPNPQFQPTTPQNGNVAKICVAQAGWTSFGIDPNDATKTVVQFWFKLIDESDGFLSFD